MRHSPACPPLHPGPSGEPPGSGREAGGGSPARRGTRGQSAANLPPPPALYSRSPARRRCQATGSAAAGGAAAGPGLSGLSGLSEGGPAGRLAGAARREREAAAMSGEGAGRRAVWRRSALQVSGDGRAAGRGRGALPVGPGDGVGGVCPRLRSFAVKANTRPPPPHPPKADLLSKRKAGSRSPSVWTLEAVPRA